MPEGRTCGALGRMWSNGGKRHTALTIQMDFGSFDDYWAPFLTGVGPSGSYVSSLDALTQVELKEHLREKLAKGNDDTAFSIKARAWAVRGEVGE